jgi:hypothetical protein
LQAYVNLLEDTAREQNKRLNEPAPAPVHQPVVEPEGDFFQDPRLVLRQEMDRMMAPIREEIAGMKAGATAVGAWQQARDNIPNFARIEPYVRQLIQQQGLSEQAVDYNTIRTLTYTARGYMQEQGISLDPTPETPTPTPTPQPQGQPVNIPQHRPSSAPLPQAPAPIVRELTELERRLARESNMSEDEYRAWGDLEDEEVVMADREALSEGRIEVQR